ncbi:MAG: zinc-dependent peptidase [Ferruginibacter sp.]|nr:zinc-dependent peptidase [Ferruginibacter sp.]
MQIAILFLFIVALIYIVKFLSTKKQSLKSSVVATDDALNEIPFYQKLNPVDKARFLQQVNTFLQTVTITAVNTTITNKDKILVAASATIPMFAFDGWVYPHLEEVLLYNDHFNMGFETEGNEDRHIMGLVGTGVYKNKMLLSKPALQQGFENKTDKGNTAIHEFVHLVDAADGNTDGTPEILLNKKYVLPWMNLIHAEMEKMKEGDSDINPYGYTNKSEFFAVAAEYFFERPDLFEDKHPEMYKMMQQIFKTR